jgi:hypothetical protein
MVMEMVMEMCRREERVGTPPLAHHPLATEPHIATLLPFWYVWQNSGKGAGDNAGGEEAGSCSSGWIKSKRYTGCRQSGAGTSILVLTELVAMMLSSGRSSDG